MSVRETFRIIECTDISELAALSDNNKELYKLFVSATVINFDEGSVAMTRLFAMFPEGTTTGDKLRDYQNGLVDGPYVPNPE